MLDFLTDRLKQRKQQRAALVDQEAQKLKRVEQLKGMVKLLKDLLKDARYEAYAQLLKDTRDSLFAEREDLLRTARDGWEQDVLLISGRIMQLEYILTTPEQFFALAEQGEANGSAARPQAREPVR